MKRIAVILSIVLLFNILPLYIYAEGETVSVVITTGHGFDRELFVKKFGAEIKYSYEKVLSGFMATVNEDRIEEIKTFPGVEGVFAEAYYRIPEPVEPDGEEVPPSGKFRIMSEEDAGFDGEGTAVAVIDSGCNISNAVFSLPSDTSAVKFTKSDISNILSANDLNAESAFPSLTANNVYKNAKFPFVFDYDSSDLDVYNKEVPHGNSVAGIVGGCGTSVNGGADYYGVLPQCQLIIMKVVASTGAIREGDMLAAMEDAVSLGVDAINISIGSVSGFSTSQAGEFDFAAPVAAVRQAGIFVSISAGNDGFLDRNGFISKNSSLYPSALNPDYGVVSTPAVCFESMAAASATISGTSMAGSSSWGPSPDLKLKPDISAPGVSVTVARNANGIFVTSSGTSYSAPYLCGKGVIAANYLKSKGNYSGLSLSRLTDSLLMSSADIIKTGPIPLSPRKQGSGFVNIDRALSINSILYGSDGKTKLSPGDFSGNTLTMSFYVKNISDSAVSYSPSASVITDKADGDYLTLTPEVLAADSITFTPSRIDLSPGEEKEVSLRIVLNNARVSAKSAVFQNGFYVEGFIVLSGNGTNDDVINMPYSAFHGNWLDAPVFIPSNLQYTTGFAAMFSGSTPADLFYFGNDLIKSSKAPTAAPSERVSFSPDGNGLLDKATLYLGTYRNIRTVHVVITDKNGNTVKTLSLKDYAKTSIIYSLNNGPLVWDGKNASGDLCPDGQYYYTITADLDYPNGQNASSLTLPIFLDTTPPEIGSVTLSFENGRKYLELSPTDNHLVMSAVLSDGSTRATISAAPEASASGAYRFDITDLDNESFLLEAVDYALNIAGMTVTPGRDYVAYYNAAGALTRAFVYDIADTANPPQRDFVFESGDLNAKRFIWTYNMKPVGLILP